MSPRRVAIKRLALLVSLLAVLSPGCIFSPEEKVVPDPPVRPPESPAQLIAMLADAYQRRNYPMFENLLPNPEDNAPYYFYLYEALPDGQTYWDRSEELRIHRRMFEPENVLPGESPVPTEYWLAGITISLTPIRDFVENPTYYYDETNNPEGLDPAKWKVVEAEYHADITFETANSDTDYRVDGRANFVVIEDLAKALGDNRKFLIYRWEDLGSATKPASSAAPAI